LLMLSMRHRNHVLRSMNQVEHFASLWIRKAMFYKKNTSVLFIGSYLVRLPCP
jgi:hypothetical protein